LKYKKSFGSFFGLRVASTGFIFQFGERTNLQKHKIAQEFNCSPEKKQEIYVLQREDSFLVEKELKIIDFNCHHCKAIEKYRPAHISITSTIDVVVDAA